MEELENKLKENEEYLQDPNIDTISDEFENELNELTKNLGISEKKVEKYIKYDVFFHFTIKNKDFVFQIKSDLFNLNEQYAYELIQNIVEKINEKKIIINYNNTKYNISLKDCEDDEKRKNKDFYIKNYEFKPCNKKNFIPKKDSESFPSDTLLKNFDSKKISFIAKSPLNIMIREKMETTKEEGDNKYQNYYDED